MGPPVFRVPCTELLFMKSRSLIALVCWCAVGGISLSAAIVLQNGVCQLTLEPDRGGACSALSVKDGAFAFTLPTKSELLLEVFSREAMDEGGTALRCVARRLSEQPDRVGAEFTTSLNSTNAGDAVSGLQFTKMVILHTGRRCVEVQQTLRNPTKDVMAAQFGNCQRVILNSVPARNEVYLPSTRNVLRVLADTIDSFYTRDGDWEYQPAGGWLADLNGDGGPGL